MLEGGKFHDLGTRLSLFWGEGSMSAFYNQELESLHGQSQERAL